MMIFLSGDTHGSFSRIKEFCKKMNLGINDILILLGDTELNYHLGAKDNEKKEFLQNIGVTFFIIRGNHEKNPENMSIYNRIKYKGATALVQLNYPNLIFAVDGEIYDLEDNGKKTIVIGGAYSIDKELRISYGDRWFKDEQPSEETMRKVEEKLRQNDWTVDYVLTHAAPLRYEPREWFLKWIDQKNVDKSTERWLDYIFSNLSFEKWYCAHYHGDKTIDKMRILYKGYCKLGE